MAQEIPETTYVPEVAEDARKERERRTVQDGTALWKRRKEELERQKHREQRELQQILENYSPWGKPGGGAPCAATLRKKNVPLEPLEPAKCQNFGQGWTSDATIERLHRKHINPIDVTDMNRFFDDKAPSGVGPVMPPVEYPRHRHRYNEQVQVYELTGGVELVPLLTSRRYYSQPQSTRYVATDATRPGYAIEPKIGGMGFSEVHPTIEIVHPDLIKIPEHQWEVKENEKGVQSLCLSKAAGNCPRMLLDTQRSIHAAFVGRLRRLGVGNREYITELVEQMRRKREHALEERRMEQESCRRHFDTWRRLWGRPGHGAPIDHAHRNNLYNILYRPAIY